MKKFLTIILIVFLYSNVFAQWSPKQQKSIDSLKAAIALLGEGSYVLGYGKLFIGDINNNMAARTISGDFGINHLGVGAIGNSKITNAMLAGSIDPSKLLASGRTISQSELAAIDGAIANFQEQIDGINIGTGYILLNYATKQTSTSEIYFSEDGIRYVSAATSFSSGTRKAGIPAFTSNPTLSNLYNGDIYYLGGQTDTDGSGLPLHTIKLVGLDADYNRVLLTFWDAVKVQRVVDNLLLYTEATTSNSATDTLDFSNKKIVTDWFGSSFPQTVEVVNYTPKTVTCFVQSNEGVTFDFNGKTVKYADNLHLPAFTDEKIYLVTMIYSQNMVFVSYVLYE